MRRLLGLILVGTVLGPGILSAGFPGFGKFRNPCNNCDPCRTCQVNPCQCGHQHQPMFAPPVSNPLSIPQPVMPQTTMVPQTQTVPVITYRDVARTEYRTQAEVQNVPVTQMKSVLVDEGGWQQVWVSKMVQKQIPETVYQQQTVYRQVPIQVTQRVQDVTYQSQTRMIPVTTAVRTGCDPCGQVPGGPVPMAQPYVAPSPPPAIGAVPPPPEVSMAPVSVPGYGVSPYGTVIPTAYAPSSPALAGLPQVYTPRALPPLASYSSGETGREVEPLRSASRSSGSIGLSPEPDPRFGTQASRGNGMTPVMPSRTASSGSTELPLIPAPSAASVWQSRFR